MPTRVLAITNEAGTGRIYAGGSGGASTLVVEQQDATRMDRCAINPFAPLLQAVIGEDKLWYTTDGGLNWSSTAYNGNGDPVRAVQWLNATTLFWCTYNKLFWSTDGGITVTTETTPAFSGDEIMDAHWVTDQVGYVVSRDLTAPSADGGYVNYTTNGGGVWTERTLQALLGGAGYPPALEAPRRILNTGTVGSPSFILVTSHKVYRCVHSPTFFTITPSVLWNYEPVVFAAFPFYPVSGYDGAGADVNQRFDEIEKSGNRIWLGGYNSLRAHSFDNGVTWFLTDLSSSVIGNDNYHHASLDANRVFAGSSQVSSALYPYRPGLTYSTDGAINMLDYLVFPNNESLAHVDAFDEPDTIGCSHPEACNYEEGITLDDNSCQHAVLLTNCSSGVQIHTSSQSIVDMACRGPKGYIDIQALDGGEPDQSITFIINGLNAFTYSSSIPTAGPPLDRLVEFVQGLIAYINDNTPFRAALVPAALNPLVPGWAYGIAITTSDNNYANATLTTLHSGLIAVTHQAFDTGSAGMVVQVAEYPGECWTVCGSGNCALVEPLTLVASYTNCILCTTRPANNICMDCSNQAYVGSVALQPNGSASDANCVTAGNTLNVYLRASFPDRTQVNIPVYSGGTCAGCPFQFIVLGDKTIYFPVGSTFSTDPEDDVYTVASVSYDSVLNQTTVITVENCQGSLDVTTLLPYESCPCNVRVLLEQYVNGSYQAPAVFDVTYQCEDGNVTQDISVVIPQYGTYRLRIIASDCAETKECIYWMSACEEYKVVETGCHQYEVRMARTIQDPANETTVKITDAFDNAVLLETIVTDAQFPFQFTNDKDTVYLIEITSPLGSVWKTEVIDLCDLLTCRKNLTLGLFCEEDPCGDEMTHEEELSRTELTRIGLVVSQLEYDLFNYRYRWTGVPQYTTERNVELQRISGLVKTARKLSERCAECAEKPAPCTNC